MKKRYYQIQQVLLFLVLVRFIIGSFTMMNVEISGLNERIEVHSYVIVLMFILYLMTFFETKTEKPIIGTELSKFKKIMLHIKYGTFIPFLIALNLIAYNIFTYTLLIPVLMILTIICIVLMLFVYPFLFREYKQ